MLQERSQVDIARISRQCVATAVCCLLPSAAWSQDPAPANAPGPPPKTATAPDARSGPVASPGKQPARPSSRPATALAPKAGVAEQSKPAAAQAPKPGLSGPGPSLGAAPAAEAPLVEAAPLPAALSGVVEDSVGNPLTGVEIYLPSGGPRTRSGAGGTFRLAGLPAGPALIVARRLGYHATTVTVHLRAGESHDLDLTMAELQARPITMPAHVVLAAAPKLRSVFQAGFFLRKTSYPGGTFFDREYLLAMNPMYVSDVFRTANGMQAVRDRRGHTQWITRMNSTMNCPVRFFIDGNSVPLNGGTIDDLVQPNDVEGIEIYRGVSTVPAEFSGKSLSDDSRCGVVAIWTRVSR